MKLGLHGTCGSSSSIKASQSPFLRRVEDAAHMTIDPVVCQLVGHDSSGGIVDEDVQPVCLLLDDVCCLNYLRPLAQIALEPDNFLGCCLTHFLFDGINGTINDIFGNGEDEDFGDVVCEQGVRATIAYALRAAWFWSVFQLRDCRPGIIRKPVMTATFPERSGVCSRSNCWESGTNWWAPEMPTFWAAVCLIASIASGDRISLKDEKCLGECISWVLGTR